MAKHIAALCALSLMVGQVMAMQTLTNVAQGTYNFATDKDNLKIVALAYGTYLFAQTQPGQKVQSIFSAATKGFIPAPAGTPVAAKQPSQCGE